tara:strand:+ start:6743 stop:7321 length:579 start_codon:yes stop_codon:yes gene_type:complete
MRKGLRQASQLAKGLLDLFHYSDEVRPVIDPLQHLSNPNIRGMERELAYGTRLSKYGEVPEVIYDPYPPQSYFGTSNYTPESGLGEVIHKTTADEEAFYDVSEDMKRFMPLAREEVMDRLAEFDKKFTPYEVNLMVQGRAMSLAKEAKYLGLSNRKYRPDVYTQFNEVIPQEVQPLGQEMMSLVEYLESIKK